MSSPLQQHNNMILASTKDSRKSDAVESHHHKRRRKSYYKARSSSQSLLSRSPSRRSSKRKRRQDVESKVLPPYTDQEEHTAREKDEDREVAQAMEDQGVLVWKEWCREYGFSDGYIVTLDKVILFVEAFVLPKENHRLRHHIQSSIVPVSGTECLIQPVLKLWKEQREWESNRQTMGTRLASRFSSSLLPTGLRPTNSTSAITLPLSPNSSSPAANSSALKQGSSGTVVNKQWTDAIEIRDDDEDEDDKATLAKPTQECKDTSNVRYDVSCMQNSLSKAESIASLMESVSNSNSKNQDDDSSPGLPKTFFAQLRTSQAKTQELGMRGTFINPLWITVFEEHVRTIQTLSSLLNSKVLDIVSTATTTSGPSIKVATEAMADALTVSCLEQQTHGNGKNPILLDEQAKCQAVNPASNPSLAAISPIGLFPHVANQTVNDLTVNTPGLTLNSTLCSTSPVNAEIISTTTVAPGIVEATAATSTTSNIVPYYRLSSNTRTVFDIWKEWTVGFDGGPSIVSLHEKYDLKWLTSGDRVLYRENRAILLEAERLVRLKHLTAMGALQELENSRIRAGQDIRQFAARMSHLKSDYRREKVGGSAQAQA
ncbi:hypothetical protein BGX34_011887 [Mortierella sp. NVP85]|nr:hypothetical protein BGX34_011887 [Mortierella sp. NVP85]